jgi:predicted RNA-binding protein with PIN domain
MKITVVAGKAHKKHTEGGDFRQATYRAVRQGLMEAKSILLEPMYDFELEIPSECVGRAMTDIKRLYGSFDTPQMTGDNALIIGRAPIATMLDYHSDVLAYSKGRGSLRCSFGGYAICHNSDEVIEQIGYDALSDTNNPASSIFCTHGAGYNVPWDEVKENMHLDSYIAEESDSENNMVVTRRVFSDEEYALGVEEVDDIIKKASGANQNTKKSAWKYSHKNEYTPAMHYVGKSRKEAEYILVDGYNVIHAWEDLADLAADNMNGARDKLLDILCNYQAIVKKELIAVFDAYKVSGHREEYSDYKNIHVVYTAEAQTADRYIEAFAHNNANKYNITVVTSDGQEQIIVMGQGCNLFSSREFLDEVKLASKKNMEKYKMVKEPAATTRMSEIIEKSIDNYSSKCNNSND